MISTLNGTMAVPHGNASHRDALRVWLYGVAALILAMIVVGGATRLTGSGLSITEWKPILGVIPPLSDADWQDAFHKYQQIPQYKILNQGMSLAEFKVIYWWEWAHRFIGRFIGVAFFVPFLFFVARGAITRELFPKLAGIFLLGGAQGALGWYMVASGLIDRTEVSPYRLAAHLGLAVALLGAVLWLAFDLARSPVVIRSGRALKMSAAAFNRVNAGAIILLCLIALQILAGAFVSGTRAALSHNTWPLMDRALIPDGLGAMQPWYLNLFENVLTVQFNHRMLGYAVLLVALANAVVAIQVRAPAPLRHTAILVAGIALTQVVLGILTLLSHLQLGLALAHQVTAIVLFGAALYHLHRVRNL